MSDDESSIDGSLEDFLAREGIKGFMGSGKKTVDDLSFDSRSSGHGEEDMNASFTSTYSADPLDTLNLIDLLLPSAVKIGEVLKATGHTPISITKHDIDASKKMSVYVVDAWAQSILSCLAEMKDRIDAQSSAVKSTSISTRKSEVTQDALEMRVRELQEKLLEAERKVKSSDLKIMQMESESSGSASKVKSSSVEAKRTLRNLEDKLAESERRVRQRDMDIEKLTTKLRSVAEKEKDTSKRHREALSAMKMGGADTSFTSASSMSSKSSSSTSMSRSSRANQSSPSTNDMLEAMHSQREDLERRNAELVSQVSELSASLKDALNGARNQRKEDARKKQAHDEDDEMDALEKTATAQAMYDKIRDQGRNIDKLAHRCEVYKAKELEANQLHIQLKTRNDELREALENLRLDMESRPTPRAWFEKQRELKEIEDKLHDLVMMRGEAAELAAWKKHMGTADRIKVDKRNHELGLWVLDSLPKAVTKEVLQSVCRELDVSDVSEVVPSLQKLKAVVKAVPRMERFISQICTFLFERDRKIVELKGKGMEGRERPSMEDVLPVLQNWWSEVQQLEGLAFFQDRVLAELSRREQILSRQTLTSESDDFGPGLRFRWSQKEIEKAYGIIRGCVDFEADVLKHKKSFGAAEDFLKEQPELLVNRQISHIQYLFNIPSIEGVYPRMNQVYLFHEQMSNFLNISRQALGLKGAPDASVVGELQRMILDVSGKSVESE